MTCRNKKQRKHTNTIYFATPAGARSPIFPKLCIVVEDVETILKSGNHFSIQRTVFTTGCTAQKNSVKRTDARFLGKNSVTCEANHVKCKTLMQVIGRIIDPHACRNRSKGSPLRGNCLPKRIFFEFLGPRAQTRAPIRVKFRMAKRTQVPLGRAEFHVNRCNDSPL